MFFVLVAGVVGSCGGVGVAASEREENEHIYINIGDTVQNLNDK